MCAPPVSTVEHVCFQDDDASSSPDGKPSTSSQNHTGQGIRLGDLASRYGRAFTIAVLMAAYLGHQANTDLGSNYDADTSDMSHGNDSASTSLTNLIFLVKNGEQKQQPIIIIQSWWVVAYAMIAYMMFGGRRWLVQRSISKLSRATSTALAQVASREALTKIGSSVSLRTMQQLVAGFGSQHDDENCGKRTMTLSVERPFVNVESHVASLTLRDIRDVFQYVFSCHSSDFHYDSYVSKLREPARKTIESLDLALSLSRGERVGTRTIEKSSEFGAVDALAFVGACRIFAEWMPIRLVPDGYGRFAFVMNLARRDMVGNIAKVEKVVHDYLDEKVQAATTGDNDNMVYSPSIRDILEYEIATNKIPRAPKLGGSTAALGILWLKRQLDYQTAIFSNANEIPVRFPDGRAAVSTKRGRSLPIICQTIVYQT